MRLSLQNIKSPPTSKHHEDLSYIYAQDRGRVREKRICRFRELWVANSLLKCFSHCGEETQVL